jgi:hypothetical protein
MTSSELRATVIEGNRIIRIIEQVVLEAGVTPDQAKNIANVFRFSFAMKTGIMERYQ